MKLRFALMLFVTSPLAAQKAPQPTPSSGSALTIYNQDFAVVRLRRG